MKKSAKRIQSTDDYIGSFPAPVRKMLKELRKAIREQAPLATEKMSYGIPTFFLNGNLVHFAAYEKHIGFYPASSGIREFKEKLSKFEHSKGAVRFPIDEPLPVRLIQQMVKFRVRENLARTRGQKGR
jgi:uncharacterized protein YdhG (YjbR/CyaY superfamily)